MLWVRLSLSRPPLKGRRNASAPTTVTFLICYQIHGSKISVFSAYSVFEKINLCSIFPISDPIFTTFHFVTFSGQKEANRKWPRISQKVAQFPPESGLISPRNYATFPMKKSRFSNALKIKRLWKWVNFGRFNLNIVK